VHTGIQRVGPHVCGAPFCGSHPAVWTAPDLSGESWYFLHTQLGSHYILCICDKKISLLYFPYLWNVPTGDWNNCTGEKINLYMRQGKGQAVTESFTADAFFPCLLLRI